MNSVVSLHPRAFDPLNEVIVPLPPRVREWTTNCVCSLVQEHDGQALHATVRWVIEVYPPAGGRTYPELEFTVYHAGWAQALTLQGFGPPATAEQRIGREYVAKLLHQVLSASYQARP